MVGPPEEVRTQAFSLQDIFDVLASSLRFDDVLQRILQVTLRELRAEQGSLLLLEGEEDPSLRMIASLGLPREMVKRGYVVRRGSISEHVMRERRPIIVDDNQPGTHYKPMAPQESVKRNIFSAICVPLVAQGNVLGTMNLNRTRTRIKFTQSDLETCAIIGGQAALVIANRRLQEELMCKERLAMVGLAVANISHCLKNIMTGVSGGLYLSQLGLDNKNSDMAQQGLDVLKRNVGLVSNLVLDLLDYSKKREPTREFFNLAQVIEKALEVVRFRAIEYEVELQYSVPRDLGYYGDRDQVYRALLNLVGNAVDACRRLEPGTSKQVTISANMRSRDELGTQTRGSRIHQWVVIKVEDTGEGIPEEHLGHIWDLFYSTKGSSGTGIGLPAARKMAEEHGGRIHVDSTVGKGTTFTLVLPFSMDKAQDASS